MDFKCLVLVPILLFGTNLIFAQSPNFVFILVDDQGWNGTEVLMNTNHPNSKSDFYLTPGLAQFAADGMIFSQAYAPAPKCSPSRNSILTGQSTARSKFTTTTSQTKPNQILSEPSSSTTIKSDLNIIPEALKNINDQYMTAHYGKWHLGAQGPNAHGFDRSDGNTSNGDGDNGGLIQNNPKKIFSITDSTLTFITDAYNANKPFYVQLSHYAVHDPLEATDFQINTFQGLPLGNVHDDPDYGAMTNNLDTSLVMLFDSLTNLGLMSNTYIIYFSDNGAAKGVSSNTPLKEGKPLLDEGGIRVPLFIKGPNINPGTRCDIPVIGYDFFPTIMELADNSLTNVPENVEGGSLVDVLTNNGAGTISRDSVLYFHAPHYEQTSNAKIPRSAIVTDSFKLVVNYETGHFSLYNLIKDLEEGTDLSSDSTNLVKSMTLLLRDYLDEVNAQMPTLNHLHSSATGDFGDADGDGLDDVWEFRTLLSSHYTATDDPDGDGFDNQLEHDFGMDPLRFNHSSDCAIHSISPNSGTLGVQGLSIEIDMGANPRNERPLYIKIGEFFATDIVVNENTISAKLSIPLNAPTGNNGITIEFETSTCLISDAFSFSSSAVTHQVYFLDKNASGLRDGSSWVNAFKNFNIALDAISNSGGGELWVKAGTYKPNASDRSNSIRLREGVYIYGGFAGIESLRSQRDYTNNLTILSGDIGILNDSTDNSYQVLLGADDSILDGFTIEKGNADGEGNLRLGGGIYNANASPMIYNCIFKHNYAEEGGAVYTVQTAAYPTFVNCAFEYNTALKGGAFLSRYGSHAYIDSCSFSNNNGKWRGGAVFIDYGADPVIANTSFDNNHADEGNGGAIYIDDNAAQLDGTDPIIYKSTFFNHTAQYRGGAISIYSGASTVTVLESEFHGNRSGLGGGAISIDNESALNLKNNIYSSNTGGTGDKDIDNSDGIITNY